MSEYRPPVGFSYRLPDGEWTPGVPRFQDTIRVRDWRLHKRYITTLEMFFKSRHGLSVLVPTGFPTDLRSFPFLKDGPDWAACVIHDYALEKTNIPTRSCDLMYMEAMRYLGVRRAVRKTFFLAVRLHSILVKKWTRKPAVIQKFKRPNVV